jgi:hypothetical protein
MVLTITNLHVTHRTTAFDHYSNVPFTIVNCVFKCDHTTDDYDYVWNQAKAWSEEYSKVLTIDDPKRYEEWITHHWDLNETYDGYGKSWVHDDPLWRYIPKFDCFHFREWVADCSVTRAVISELEYFKEHGKLPTVYRAVDEHIVLSHLRTLHTYWD